MAQKTGPRWILMTGITSGMGLEAARALLADPAVQIVTGARDTSRLAAPDGLPKDRVTALPLDLASLGSVAAFCGAVRARVSDAGLAALALNAGTQITTGLEMSEDGIEKTFAVNHLAHWLIAERLSDLLSEGGRIVVTASGTHDPNDPIAKRFGFRGGVFPSAARLATGDLDPAAKPAQQCLDRYATSKMANIMHVLHKAQAQTGPAWIAYDPGLMPGTGLARDRGAAERFAWNNVMPLLRHVMKGISTPARSGAMLARLLDGQHPAASGSYVEFTGLALDPWEEAKNHERQRDLEAESRRLAGDAAS